MKTCGLCMTPITESEGVFCPPCDLLGVPPPDCPSCQGRQLVGRFVRRDGGHDSWTHTCEDCNIDYPLSAAQWLLLGKAAERILKLYERKPNGFKNTGCALTLVALECGVLSLECKVKQ